MGTLDSGILLLILRDLLMNEALCFHHCPSGCGCRRVAMFRLLWNLSGLKFISDLPGFLIEVPDQLIFFLLWQLPSRFLCLVSGFFCFLFQFIKLLAARYFRPGIFYKTGLIMEVSIRLDETVLYPGSALMLPVLAKRPCFLTLGCILGISFILLFMLIEELLICLPAFFLSRLRRLLDIVSKSFLRLAHLSFLYALFRRLSLCGCSGCGSWFLKISGIFPALKGFLLRSEICRFILLRHLHHLPASLLRQRVHQPLPVWYS